MQPKRKTTKRTESPPPSADRLAGLLDEVMKVQEQKNPDLAAKQARLLEALRRRR